MRIINIYAGFYNPTGGAGWQLWDGDDLLGIYHTRAAARNALADRRSISIGIVVMV